MVLKAFEKDVTMRRAFFNYSVANYFKSHDVVRPSPHETSIVKRRRHYNKSARPRTRKARKLKTEKQRTVIGLTMFKWLMQQRCGDLAKMGGGIAALGKLGKPNQIVNTVASNAEACNVLRRNGCDVPAIGAAAANGTKPVKMRRAPDAPQPPAMH